MSIEMAVRLGAPATGGSSASPGPRVGSAADDGSSMGFSSALAGAEAASDAESSRAAEDNPPGQGDDGDALPGTPGILLVATAPQDSGLSADPAVVALTEPSSTPAQIDLRRGVEPSIVALTEPSSTPAQIDLGRGVEPSIVALTEPSLALSPLDSRLGVDPATVATHLESVREGLDTAAPLVLATGLEASTVSMDAFGMPLEGPLGKPSEIAAAVVAQGDTPPIFTVSATEKGGINGLPFSRGEMAARPELVPASVKASLTPEQDINALRLKLATDQNTVVDGDAVAAELAIELGDARGNVRTLQEIRHQADVEPLRPLAGGLVAPMVESAFRREFKSEKSIFRNDGVVQGDTFSFAKSELGMIRFGGAAGEAQTGASGYAPPQSDAAKYWISSDLKNAELKLDGLGDSPVEVSISMTGKEAHVTFRSDESQTRAMLENANAELTELLGKEGLQLSGVSVGAKGSGDSGASEQRARHAFRPVTELKELTDRVEASGRWSSGAGQAVDLFV